MEETSGRVPGVKDADILAEARKRYELASKAASENRERFKEAMRFVAGAQWDDELKQARQSQRRPCLTMDRLGTHINQIVNDQRQSKPSIKVHPVDDRADVKTAEIYNGLIRNIEHQSNAPAVYETASWTQVAAGQGVWRVLTQYADEEAFEQDIVLKRVLDPLSVTFDPNAKEMDASDGHYAFVEESVDRERFKELYPDIDPTDWGGNADDQGWWNPENIRCAEYYRVIYKPTEILLMADGSVMDKAAYQNAIQGLAAPALPGPDLTVVSSRPTKKREVQWFKIAGNSIADSRVWLGRWIPLVRVVGNEMAVDGKIIYTGLTQRAYDAQRMYNYQTSVMVEMLSLQKTAPFIGAKGQFKGVEQRWANANVTNPPYLEYEPVALGDQLAPPPTRQPAPQVPTGNVQAMQAAAGDLKWITGQNDANFGANGNEKSGRAILARQREGDTATYHYLDNLSRGILHTGRILVDLIPKIYDTKRVLRVLGEDSSAEIVQQDPDQPVAVTEEKTDDGIKRIYNLGVGRYDVAVSVGPSFGTLRQESVEAMSQLLQGNPQLWQAIGDLFVGAQDWPNAQAIADRLAKMVPPELRGEEEGGGAEKQMAQLQQALEQASQMLQEREMALQQAAQAVDQLQAKLAETSDKAEQDRINAEIQEKKLEIDAYNAETNRIKALGGGMSVEQVQQIVMSMLQQLSTAPDISTVEGPGPDGTVMHELPEGEMPEPQEFPSGEAPEME